MSTRCQIQVKEKDVNLQIYRHGDGYPEGVLADIKILLENTDRTPENDPHYFLANFIFACKLGLGFAGVTTGYGVSNPNKDKFFDTEYWYVLGNGKVVIKKRRWSSNDPEEKGWKTIFNGKLEEAYQKFNVKDGCHINVETLKKQGLRDLTKI